MKRNASELVKSEFEKRGYKLLDEYKDGKTNMTFTDKDGFMYYSTYQSIKDGSKPYIAFKNNKYSIDNIKLFMKLRGDKSELLSTEFKNINSKLIWKCICGCEFERSWYNASHMSENICLNCIRIGQRVSDDELKALTESKGFVYVGATHEDHKCFIQYKCKKHLHKGVQRMYITDMRSCEYGVCPCCRGRNKTTDDFRKELAAIDPSIIVVGEYKKTMEKIECKCGVCGLTFYVPPNGLLGGRGCPVCKRKLADEHRHKTHEWFIQKMNEVHPDIEVLSEYTGCYDKVKLRCKIDGYEWEVAASAIIFSKYGCPRCFASHNEEDLCKILDDWKFRYVTQKRYQDCRDIHALPFDIYLSDFNILIEYDGEHHYYPVTFGGISEEEATENMLTTQKHDKTKTEYAKKHNIPLIRIPYWENDTMEHFLWDEFVKLGLIEETA